MSKRWSEHGVPLQAIDDLLVRRPPRVTDRRAGHVIPGEGDLVDETIAAVRELSGGTLAIQGPPGHRQDPHGGQGHRGADRRRQAGRHRGQRPCGDQQPAGAGRGGGARVGRRSALEAGRRSGPSGARGWSGQLQQGHQARRRHRGRWSGGDRRHGLALLAARHGGHARLPLHRRGGPGLAGQCGGDGRVCHQPGADRRPDAARPADAGRRTPARVGWSAWSTCCRGIATSRPRWASSSAPRTECIPTSAASSPTPTTRGGSAAPRTRPATGYPP